MAKKKKEEPLDFENMTPEELLKYEIADEIGLGDKILKGGWKSLTSKESGRIGGLMTKRKRELKREALENDAAVQEIPTMYHNMIFRCLQVIFRFTAVLFRVTQ